MKENSHTAEIKGITLSSNISSHDNKHLMKTPPIQNLNNLILSCMKNDEYCYSMIDYLKKMIYIRQVDYYLAYTNVIYCFKPKEINEIAKIRKHLKNKYARDDPGFLLLLIINLFISSISYSITFNHFNPFFIFNIFFIQSFVMLFTFGLCFAFINKVIIDKYFKSNDMSINKEQNVEYVYAFDIHCNAFVPMYFFCGIIPFFILPITKGYTSYIQVIISNCLQCVGVMYYCYVTFMGYFSLPFVRKNKYVTLAVWPILVFYIIVTIMKVNVYSTILHWFFVD